MDREIWFEKILGGYVPCHWKGWAVMAFTIAPMLGIIVGGELAHVAVPDWLLWLIALPPALISLEIIARRHS